MTRHPCGDYVIRGKFGHIYQDGVGYLLCVHTGESARRCEKPRILETYRVGGGGPKGFDFEN
jgi:hypothetical protein